MRSGHRSVWSALRALVVALAVAGSVGCDVEPRTVRLTLVPPEALGCRPTEVTELRIDPLGDLPAESRPSVRVDPSGGLASIRLFGPETELVAVGATGVIRSAGGPDVAWEGGGLVSVRGRDLPVPLLRFGRSCLLSDPNARVPEGAVALALADGRTLIAGGHGPGGGATVTTIRPGEALTVGDTLRLFTPRTGAAAVEARQGLVVITGGAPAEGAEPLDSVEVLRVDEGAEGRVSDGFLRSRRVAHAAVAMGEGRVLLVGGVDAAPVAELVQIDADGEMQTREVRGGAPRVGPAALALDDGVVLVLGGGQTSVERYAPDTEELAPTGASLPAREAAAFVSLPGGRAAQLGGRDAVGWSGEVELLLTAGAEVVALGRLFDPVVDPVAVALGDGRVLVVGREPSADGEGALRSQLIDPSGTREPVELEAARAPTALLRLPDETLVEGDPERVSLLRIDLASELSDPQSTLFPGQPNQQDQLAPDARSRWTPDLRAAVDGARWELPRSRFRDVRVELDAEGALELLLDPEGAPAHAIEVTEDRVTFGGCEATRVGSTIVVRRVGARLSLDAGAEEVSCDFDEPARVSIAVRATAGAAVTRLAVARLRTE